MRYFRRVVSGEDRLIAESDGRMYDLTVARSELTGYGDLARSAAITGMTVDAVAERLVEGSEPVTEPPGDPAVPIEPDEVWAAGVTYEISEAAREEESDMPEMYLRVYQAERPELFFKATPERTVGPGEAVGIRADSTWDVPEPELGLVLYRGETVGYTIGNDVSSRDIEGQNPLYLPQAKVYDRSCALGPCVASPETVGDPHDLVISMVIRRGGEVVFDGETSTAEMARSCEELVDWLTRHDRPPAFTVLLTGTSLVPPEEFTLTSEDEIEIEIEQVGTLVNDVTVV